MQLSFLLFSGKDQIKNLLNVNLEMMTKVLFYWAPRLLAIVAILFMMLFSLDCFGGSNSFSVQLICLIMHNIPAFICLLSLIIAWRWERIGGILFILIFIAAGIFFNSFVGNPTSLIVIGPFLIVGTLFIVSSMQNKKTEGLK